MTFPSDYEAFIYKSRYARWLENEGRRENLDETINRYLDFFKIEGDLRDGLFQDIYRSDVMPSMRAMMTAGPALERSNVAGFNCSYLPVDHPWSFDEAMFILLCGTGVGYSVERQYTSQLPPVPFLKESGQLIVVEDSKEGWAYALRATLKALWDGHIPRHDTSLVRPAGARLKTFGGRASGPGPLIELLNFVIETFKAAQGRQLRPIECHDIMCKIGDVVVVGGVRRSAMISLTDLDDEELAKAKSGNWWVNHPYRALANISSVVEERPDAETFLKEWTALVESKSGERGIFSRKAARNQVTKTGRRDPNHKFGTNPCAEIILRPYQFCNLSEVIARADDSFFDLLAKVESATILGTYQSTMTKFSYLRPIWQQNTEEERLLGVSITGIMDHPVLNGSQGEMLRESWLTSLRNFAVEINAQWAETLGIEASVSVTCVKPSGTVSQMTNSASGIHTRHSPYYIRTVRGDNKDPITQFMKDANVPNEPCVMKPETTTIFSFPIKAPEGALTRNDLSALDQLEHWMAFQNHWCEHKPSCTITVRDEEWPEVGAWVFKNLDNVSGLSFLPHSDHVYQQAPYQEVDQETYEAAVAKFPKKLNWDLLVGYEFEDQTVAMQTLACTAAGCEL